MHFVLCSQDLFDSQVSFVCAENAEYRQVVVMMLSPSRRKDVGILFGLKPSDPAAAHINIFDPKLTPEDLWGVDTCPSGGALLDAVLTWYLHGTHNVPWFTYVEGGANAASGQSSGVQKTRSIVKSPLSRELQESTVESYKSRIFAESISQVAAGVIVFTMTNFLHKTFCFGHDVAIELQSMLFECDLLQ